MRLAVSTGSGVTGEGADVLSLDDPSKVEDAQSATERKKLVEWFTLTWSTRANDPKTSRFLVVGHRLHPRD